jgi:hypothetical protein
MSSLLGSALQTLGLSAPSPPSGATSAATATPTTPPSQIDAQVKSLQDGMADMRSLLQRTGSLLAAAGTAIVGGLGYQQLHNFFPIPPHDSSAVQFYLVTAALASALAAALGAALLARRFLTAQGRILLSSAIDDCDDVDDQERAIIARAYGEISRQELADDLADLDLRAERLSRASRATADPTLQKAFQTESDRLEGVVQLGIYQAAVGVLERRSSIAFRGSGTVAALLLAIVGIALLFGLADYSKGERDKLDVMAKCAALNTNTVKTTPPTYVSGVGNWCKP